VADALGGALGIGLFSLLARLLTNPRKH